MNLFEVTAGTRVRIVARAVRYLVQRDLTIDVARDVTFTGLATDQYMELNGENRRLVVDLDVDFWRGFGVWQCDCECEVVE